MTSIFLQGVGLGLVLAAMVGPLTVSLLHMSIEKGKTAGFYVAAGIWISDFLFMMGVYFGFQYLEKVIALPGFERGMGIAGSIILLMVGVGILKKSGEPAPEAIKLKNKDIFGAMLQGFSINSINPFTFIFWTSVMGAVVLKNQWETHETITFFSGILMTIIVSDSAKILLSTPIHHWLTPGRWKKIKWISGGAFIVFSVALLVRVLV